MSYPKTVPRDWVPKLWREFGTRKLMCSWCGSSRGKTYRVACPRCPIRTAYGRKRARLLEEAE